MDQPLRTVLLEKAIAMLTAGNTLVAVPFEEFFNGNTDESSLVINAPDGGPVELARVRKLFESIRARADVQAIFIELVDVPFPDDEKDQQKWAVAGAADIITSAPLAEVTEWVLPLHPHRLTEGWNVGEEIRTPMTEEQIDPGMRPVRVWLR